MFAMSKYIDLDVLISLLIDCQKAQHAQRQGFSEKKRRMKRMKLCLKGKGGKSGKGGGGGKKNVTC